MRRAPTVAVRLLVVGAVLAVLGVPAAAQNADQSALERARSRVSQVESQLRSARAAQADADRQLAEADAQLAALEAAVNEAAAALERQELAVEEAGARVARLEADAVAQQREFAVRAAALYKRGVGPALQVILDATSIAEAVDRGAYVQVLSASDRAALETLVASRTAVDAERQRLAAERDRLVAMKAEQERLLADVARLREHRALQAAAARADVHALETQHAELTEDSRRLADALRARQRAATSAAPAPVSAGAAQAAAAPPVSVTASGYAWPRCDRVSSEFGRRWGRQHEGIDIDGDTGDAVHAAKAGVVISAGWRGGYGRLVLIDHGDGVVTAYAHLSAFAVGAGANVSQGQVIGSVGATGNATGSHLHFETRVNGDPVNPRRLLPASC